MGLLSQDIQGIVFDAVGTLIHPRRSVAATYTEAAERQGVRLDPAEVRARFQEHFGRDQRESPGETDEERERARWRGIVAAVLPEVARPDQAFEELWAHFGQAGAWRAYPDVGPALRRLRAAGFRTIIASNFDARLRVVLRGLAELADWAESVVISSEIGFRKPDPRFYGAVVSRLALPAGEVLCVGDDPENDLAGPRRAGLGAVLLDREGRWGEGVGPRARGLGALADDLIATRGGTLGNVN